MALQAPRKEFGGADLPEATYHESEKAIPKPFIQQAHSNVRAAAQSQRSRQ
jgi:hypothetical protein